MIAWKASHPETESLTTQDLLTIVRRAEAGQLDIYQTASGLMDESVVRSFFANQRGIHSGDTASAQLGAYVTYEDVIAYISEIQSIYDAVELSPDGKIMTVVVSRASGSGKSVLGYVDIARIQQHLDYRNDKTRLTTGFERNAETWITGPGAVETEIPTKWGNFVCTNPDIIARIGEDESKAKNEIEQAGNKVKVLYLTFSQKPSATCLEVFVILNAPAILSFTNNVFVTGTC